MKHFAKHKEKLMMDLIKIKFFKRQEGDCDSQPPKATAHDKQQVNVQINAM